MKPSQIVRYWQRRPRCAFLADEGWSLTRFRVGLDDRPRIGPPPQPTPEPIRKPRLSVVR